LRLLAPVKFHNKLSQHSILALVGLMAFASIVLVANPFVVHSSGSGSVATVNASPPSTVSTTQSTQQQGAASGGQGSLLTGAPTTQTTGHHHHDDGNSTSDS